MEIAKLSSSIDTLIATAIDDPTSLVEWSRFPEVNRAQAEDIMRCASETSLNLKADDLTYYDFGESWDHFFYFLNVFREICRENSETGKAMLLIWNFS
jgi:hypothetical protein